MRRWKRDELPALDQFKGIDHHHNTLRRLKWLPPSHRGTQIRRSVAFAALQFILDSGRTRYIYLSVFYTVLY